MMSPFVLHVVIALDPGGLERLVVDWANARNRQYPGSTLIACLDELGVLAGQVDQGAVVCVGAKRGRFPWDQSAVRRIVELLGCSVVQLLGGSPKDSISSTTQQPDNSATPRESAATQQPANSTTVHRLPPVVLHCHNLAAWQYGVLAKLLRKTTDHRPQTSDIRNQSSVISIQSSVTRRQAPDIRQETESPTANHRLVRHSSQSDGGSPITDHRSPITNSPSPSGVCGLKSGVSPAIRLIYTQHGANVHNMRLRDRIRARILACFTDEIVAVSSATADVMAKTMWVKRNRIKVIPNGIDVDRFGYEEDCDSREGAPLSASGGKITKRIEIRNKYGIPADAWVIGSVGRLAYVKGHDRLIAAFAALNRHQTLDIRHQTSVISNRSSVTRRQTADIRQETESPTADSRPPITDLSAIARRATADHRLPIIDYDHPSSKSEVCCLKSVVCYLLLVGEGPDRANLERQARELGVADRVVFAGYQPDPVPYLNAMDLFVLPSRSEGLSVALLEAMAAGVPVAVTDVGANLEVVSDGQCGIILAGDEQEWYESMVADMHYWRFSAKKEGAGKAVVQDRYSLSATLESYGRLYYAGGNHQ